jgi:murein DD-endopeptidase MepM/ murein hydrolase activator NlpD
VRNGLHKLFLFILAFFCLPFVAYADTAQQIGIALEPVIVGPGDIAVVMVKNAGDAPGGSFNNRRIYFYPSSTERNVYKAILGIDLYTVPGEYTLEIAAANTTIRRIITVSKKKYPMQRLTLPKDMVELSPENEARVEREQKKVAAIWPVDSIRIWSGNFVNPLPGKPIGTPFGVRRIINKIPKSSHSGIDITAEEGDEVHAPNNGVAVLIDDQFYSGNSIVLDHGQGIYTMFFHLSKILVTSGQYVNKGDVIGLVGSTGRSTGAHLHWGVRIQGARVDPKELINLKLD